MATITEEFVLKRIEVLTAKRTEFLANANACAGAIEDCHFWLDRLKAEEPVNVPVTAGPSDGIHLVPKPDAAVEPQGSA